ncbi:MAG TPA: alpha-1,4-glucan--maltose-1-phosphate maltosyltransferase [Gemmatimonadaceae bacterium]|nr:alpha-1,4-glucan--maltose-1-phosphate maltosyltransferase [Gemmatimonadaceae bacterium]
MTPAKKSTTRAKPKAVAAERYPHLVIECVQPELDCGRFPVKRVIGDEMQVGADIFKDGHDLIAGRILYRGPDETDWRSTPLTHDYNRDRWLGSLTLDRIGMWTYTVEAWTDVFRTWRSELEKKISAGQNVTSELLEGAQHVATAARTAKFGEPRTTLTKTAAQLRDESIDPTVRAGAALAPGLLALMEEHLRPRSPARYERELRVWVDRERARFAAWYELFPRSTGPDASTHGTFETAAKALDRIAALGFDVVYLPPVHPIGIASRKGKNNTLEPGPSDPGSPWAIGGPSGGHTAIAAELGTIEDFDRFVRRAGELGMEVALDYALQCSPDHPWLKEHPDWFFVRPDGTLKYAENPPKKYQDIYPLDFWCDDRQSLWSACRDIFLYWLEHGVRTFRVDNPHTKPMAFWEWVIPEVQRHHPEAIFLAEAFTRPKRMKHLAKLGFTQSYTYFTWRNSAEELREYLTELAQTPMREYFRGNLFVNTPDILHEYLVSGGPHAFRIRLLLAATLSPVYGIYSGFELYENVPLKPGSEEYLHSEKYELRPRDYSVPGNLDADIRRVNAVRRQSRALQHYDNLTFGESENPNVLVYAKTSPTDDLVIAVTTHPHVPQETIITVPLAALGIGADQHYVVEDLLTGARYTWHGARNYVRLDPASEPGHVLRIVRQ